VRADTITWRYGLNPWDPSTATDWEASPLTAWQSVTWSGGNFSGQFNVSEGGWYRFQIRAMDWSSSAIDTVFSGWFRVRTFFEDYQIIQRDIGGTPKSVTISGTCKTGLEQDSAKKRTRDDTNRNTIGDPPPTPR